MADGRQRAEVEIFGRTYTLESDQSPEYARKVAEDVNERMEKIAASQNTADTTKIAMMAAMQIADELIRAREIGQDRLAAAESAKERLGTVIDWTGH